MGRDVEGVDLIGTEEHHGNMSVQSVIKPSTSQTRIRSVKTEPTGVGIKRYKLDIRYNII
jgi:hypothetical protein